MTATAPALTVDEVMLRDPEFGPVRLRALPEDVPRVELKGGLPVWLVVLVIVAAVAGGVLVSSLR